MRLEEFLSFARRHQLAVEASVSGTGAPQAAVIGYVVSDAFELFFDTLADSRKAQNLDRDGRVAFVIGWDLEQAQTLQLEGVADRVTGPELARLLELYFESFPDGRERQSWPGIRYYRVRPTWLRLSDFRGATAAVNELIPTGSTWDAGRRVLETRLSGQLGVAEVERWQRGIELELARVSAGSSFKLLNDVSGFTPRDAAAARSQRSFTLELLAAYGVRPPPFAEADSQPELQVVENPNLRCSACAHVYGDEQKVRDHEAHFASGEQRFFAQRSAAERWLDEQPRT